jgi:hypothetical protein
MVSRDAALRAFGSRDSTGLAPTLALHMLRYRRQLKHRLSQMTHFFVKVRPPRFRYLRVRLCELFWRIGGMVLFYLKTVNVGSLFL